LGNINCGNVEGGSAVIANKDEVINDTNSVGKVIWKEWKETTIHNWHSGMTYETVRLDSNGQTKIILRLIGMGLRHLAVQISL
jgi:hypothetical protein